MQLHPHKCMMSDQEIKENITEVFIENESLPDELTEDDYGEVMTYFDSSENQRLENCVKQIGETANHSNQLLKQAYNLALKSRKYVVQSDSLKQKPQNQQHETTQKHVLKTNATHLCSKCGNVYSKRSSLECHLNIHNGLKPYKCEICQNSYRMMSDLKDHMHRHTGEKPFKCKFCERQFIDRSSRHRHERLHTNTRPYECKACCKRFSYSTILKNHMKIHTGEKNFECHICNKSFTLQHQLKSHIQTMSHKRKETYREFQKICTI